MKIFSATGAALVLALVLTQGAWGLSADQVQALTQAGVSEQTITSMQDIEEVVRKRGLQGRYVARSSSDGRPTILYQADGPLGEEEYPIRLDPSRFSLLAAILSADSGGGLPVPDYVPQAKSYSLLLASYRNEASAKNRAKKLAEAGLAVRVLAVELPEGGQSFRILFGEYASHNLAEEKGRGLKSAGSIVSYSVVGN